MSGLQILLQLILCIWMLLYVLQSQHVQMWAVELPNWIQLKNTQKDHWVIKLEYAGIQFINN